jgi:hypothetical protein
MKNKQTMPGKVDWLNLERRIRDAFRELKASAATESDTLRAISDVLGDETGRGYPMDAQLRTSAAILELE